MALQVIPMYQVNLSLSTNYKTNVRTILLIRLQILCKLNTHYVYRHKGVGFANNYTCWGGNFLPQRAENKLLYNTSFCDGNFEQEFAAYLTWMHLQRHTATCITDFFAYIKSNQYNIFPNSENSLYNIKVSTCSLSIVVNINSKCIPNDVRFLALS